MPTSQPCLIRRERPFSLAASSGGAHLSSPKSRLASGESHPNQNPPASIRRTAGRRITMQNSETSMTNTVTLPDRLKREMPEIADGQQDSEVLTENRVSELTADSLIESPFRISHYPNSRFWAVYDGDA